MGIYCDKIKGFTVDLTDEEAKLVGSDFIHESEYSWWRNKDHKKTYIVDDGMSGEYTRIVFAERISYDVDYFEDDETFFVLQQKEITDEIYNSLNELYKLITNKDLDKSRIVYALWYHYH